MTLECRWVDVPLCRSRSGPYCADERAKPRGRSGQPAAPAVIEPIRPPSTIRLAPLIHGVARLARKAMAGAMSEGLPTLPTALIAQSIAPSPIDSRKSVRIGVSITPGDTELRRMPRDHQRCELDMVQTITASLEKLYARVPSIELSAAHESPSSNDGVPSSSLTSAMFACQALPAIEATLTIAPPSVICSTSASVR